MTTKDLIEGVIYRLHRIEKSPVIGRSITQRKAWIDATREMAEQALTQLVELAQKRGKDATDRTK